MGSILRVQNISRKYRLNNWMFGRNNTIDAIDNISFELQQGKTLAIVGESGSGKSTLARQLVGIERPSSGQVFIDERPVYELTEAKRKTLFLQVRMIFQNPFASLNPRLRIGSILEEPLIINTSLNANQRRDKVESVLQKVGLRAEHARRFPHMFSGGQRQRIAIARALILEPKVIVADEPLSALDVSVQAQILNLLLALQEEFQISYVFISHDLGVVEHIADQVLVMYRGQVMEYGDVEQIFDTPKHPYTQTLFASTPIFRDRVTIQTVRGYTSRSATAIQANGCPFAKRCPCATEQCTTETPKTRNISGQLITCHSPLL
ncbi:dipeptide ABC transporter ATP-binding protein [Pleionea sp. CnH1-48]|uniref:dipeptide ABC transporter ATP-binding protein n=1 Tax=Pleionea sp. CnH1-48 TaxID=2954494 RepID=UPI002097B448|nr:dipeptide ABC transporter ATP-binding protein [Pleionea sp. CnH1-48]MCO7225452.1 dipeptide ABC transporter ATP-binding protein [Pleionea sp. CnH1-48]